MTGGGIRVLALFGSPHRKGMSGTLHEELIRPLAEKAAIKRVFTYELSIEPCDDCGGCRSESRCIKDDMMGPLYDELEESDILTISSPLYFTSLPGPLKTFIDRCQVIWEKRKRGEAGKPGKKGFFICSAEGNYRDMFMPAVITVRHFFNTIGYSFEEDKYILVTGERLDPSQPSSESLKRAYNAGRDLLDKIISPRA